MSGARGRPATVPLAGVAVGLSTQAARGRENLVERSGIKGKRGSVHRWRGQGARQRMDQMDKTSQRAGSWWLAGMGLMLAVAGTVFTMVLWKAWQRAEETLGWTEVPCKVLSSQIKSEQASRHSPVKHRVIVRYEYSWQGSTLTSERIRRVDGVKSDLSVAEELRERYARGQQTVCFVNPADPSFAILVHDTRAALYSIWFPLLFVFGGLRMMWSAIKARSTPLASALQAAPRR